MIKAIASKLLPPDIKQTLCDLGVECIEGYKSPHISNETAYHPDMMYFLLANGKLLSADNKASTINILDTFVVKDTPKDGYPSDCVLNCFFAKKCLFCGHNAAKEIVSDAIQAGFEVVRVKQGYAACSTVKVTDSAFICSDSGIAKALSARGFDVLQVTNDGISLTGYNNGFIGGCSISTESFVGFTGNIELHRDYKAIKGFIENHNKKVISLCKRPLYDYGGFIVING